MSSRLVSFYYGATLPARAAKLIFSHPRMLFWSALPTALTLSLYGTAIHVFSGWARAYISGHITGGSFFVVLLTEVLIYVVAALTFSFMANLISTPFNDFLAEETERWAEPKLSVPEIPSQGIFAGYWRNKVRLIGIDGVKTTAALTMEAIALLCSWIPVVNVLAFLLTFMVLSFQFISYPQTRRGQPLGIAVTFLYRHFFACLGFGAVVSVLFSIPIISSLSIPLAVVGGTLLVARAQEPGALR